VDKFKAFLSKTKYSGEFFILLFAYLSARSVNLSKKEKLINISDRLLSKVANRFDTNHENSISRLDLIDLAVKNMAAKKTRTLVTIGGMIIGIGAIVFLVSVGYGLQQVVISRVARLDEMKQADVITQPGSKIKINDKTLSDFMNLGNVQMTLPLIAVVGRVSYQNSVSDMPAYGVTSDFLKQSAIKPVEGKIFDSNNISLEVVPKVAGVETSLSNIGETGEVVRSIEFSVNPDEWIKVRSAPTTTSLVVGYTKRYQESGLGEEVWGSKYIDENGNGKSGVDESGKTIGKWIKAKVLIWKEEKCTIGSGDCENGKYIVSREIDGSQTLVEGYFAEIGVNINSTGFASSDVLGTTTSAGADGSLPFVEIASEAGIIAPVETKTVSLADGSKFEAVVNTAMLKVLGINSSQAVGKEFSTSFIVTGDLLSDSSQKIASIPVTYKIVGVTPDDKTPLFYVPFMDIRSMGIDNYSQVKVVASDQNILPKLRRQIEAMGYVTTSVSDTVTQINSLFATARAILALVGIAALAVAALGMFNTLTVSLLERTREVGLMKALGMKSSEIRELFLAESMIMGFVGGILGILFGFLVGKLLGLILSIFSVIKGVGFVDVSYIPFSFFIIIVFLSLLVGITTGLYPAKRATKISALNALRYE